MLLNVSVPTRFRASDHLQLVTLDQTIVSSHIARNCTSNIIHDFLGSDHSMILTSINDFTVPTKLHIPKWNFQRADWLTFSNECLRQINNKLVSTNIEKFSDQLTESLLAVATATIPQTQTGRKKKSAPWWNNECAVAIRNKKHAFSRMKRSRRPSDIIAFKRFRAH